MIWVDTFMNDNIHYQRHMDFELEPDTDNLYLEQEPEEVFMFWGHIDTNELPTGYGELVPPMQRTSSQR